MVKVFTATLKGLQPSLIEVEIESTRGTPQLIIIGLASKTVIEAKERIVSALTACGVRLKTRRTIVNLAPANLPKQGSGLDLAIAVSILRLHGQVKIGSDDWLFLGELALDGQIRAVPGTLPLCLSAQKMGFKHIVIPLGNAQEVSLVSKIKIHPISHLNQLLATYPKKLTTLHPNKLPKTPNRQCRLNQIIGQTQAKRALAIAAAGGHNLLLVGPPGVGKSLLAKNLIDLLPDLSLEQTLQVTAIHSVSGLNHGQLLSRPQFRAPHHSITQVGMLGGGHHLVPGEISLAHSGVLFLDELTEFDRSTIESLRQPLETGLITHVRQSGHSTYRAECLLVAATNPCPCGWHQSQSRACHCSLSKKRQYLAKLSGPILDRIDLQVWVDIPQKNLDTSLPTNDSQTELFDSISKARMRQAKLLRATGIKLNSRMNSTQIRQLCQISEESWQLLKAAQSQLGLSVRASFNTLRVAQTIADLAQFDQILPEFVAEALQFRTLVQLSV